MLKGMQLIEGETRRYEGASRRFSPEGPQTEPVLDLRFLFGVMRRQLWLIVATVVVAVAIALVLFSMTPPTYESNARVVLDSPRLDPFGDEAIFTGIGQDNPEIESQMQVIRSEYTLAQVVERLDLDDREGFLSSYQTPFRLWMSTQIDNLRALVFGLADEDEELVGDEGSRVAAAVDKLRDNLSVTRVGLTYVLNLSYTSNSAQLSADIANGVAEVFIQERINQRQESANDASGWFVERVAELNAQALEAERRVSEFRAANGIVEASNTSRLNEQQLADLSGQLTSVLRDAEASRAKMEQLNAIVADARTDQPLPSGLSSPPLNAMFERRQQLVIDRLRFEQENGVDHPATVDVVGRIASLDTEIESEVRNLLAQAVAEHEAALLRVRDAQARYDGAIGGAQQLSQSQIQLQALESEASVYRTLHDEYLQNYLQTIQQQSFPAAEARIIQTAMPADYISSPRLSLMVLIAGTIGLASGVAMAFGAEFMDRRIRSRAQLAAATSLPNLGVLPSANSESRSKMKWRHQPTFTVQSKRKPSDIQYHDLPVAATSLVPAAFMTRTIDDPVSSYAETLRKLRAEVERETSSSGNTVAFISDTTSTARSVAAVNYAEMLALGGARTLLIDLNWHQAFLSETLSPAATMGLADYIVGGYQNKSAGLWTDERTGLQFLPNRSLEKQTALDPSIFDTERLKTAIERLSEPFRYIVIDMSSLADSSDASAVADRIDAYVVVASWGETHSGKLEAELSRATIPREKLVGTVLANVDMRQLAKYE